MSDIEQIALISGCSSGIGFATAVEMARNGFFVYATMRDLEKSENLKNVVNTESLSVSILQMDVGKQETIDAAIEKILQEKGRIDVLVNNAGFMRMGSLEDMSMEYFIDQMDTDFFGPIRLLKKVIPVMREQKSGHIFNIFSNSKI